MATSSADDFMKATFRYLLLTIALIALGQAQAGLIHRSGQTLSSLARSEISLNQANAEFPFLNLLKNSGGGWGYGNNSGGLKPDELTGNGYPLAGATWTTLSGASTLVTSPAQAIRPGHYVLIAWGASTKLRFNNNSGSATGIACTGTATTGGGPLCDNTACSTFTGSIAGTTLTVTAAPTGAGCTLGAGVPLTGAGVITSTFGTPTIIAAAGSVCGGNTCYTINQSQTVASTTLSMGFRIEVSATDTGTSTVAQWQILLNAISGTLSGIAVFHINDEAAYWISGASCGGAQAKACLIGTQFKTRMQQANFRVVRDLDLASGNVSSCTTWSSRKTLNYFSYLVTELRNAASGPGQYVNAAGTGATGGTVSYNAGTDIYSITLGSGNFVDKQTILVLWPATGTAASKVSLNGNTAVQLMNAFGVPITTSYIPQSGAFTTLVYDITLGPMSWANTGNTNSSSGMLCGVPPEVMVELNAELGTTPWHNVGVMSIDPMTDWETQYATYIKNNYSPPSPPIFEPVNEPWNCSGQVFNSFYASAKSAAYIASDANHAWVSGGFCGSGGNYNSWVGKVSSTIGQDLNTTLGAGNYEMPVPVQTYFGGSSGFNDVLRSAAYIGQSMVAQAGYTQVAAYTLGTRISVNNYWHAGFQATAGLEVGPAYCYYNYSISATCQGLYISQAAIMTAYMNSATQTTCGTTSCQQNNIGNLVATFLPQWQTFGINCSQVSRPGNCNISATAPLMFYEGGFDPTNIGSDVTQSFTVASNQAVAILTIANNGCVAGQTVALSGLSGGTWSTAAGTYTVQASGTDSGHCAINLNSTGLGTLSAATLTYTGSQSYVNYLRAAAYTAPEQDTLVSNLYATIVSSLGGVNPSQYQFASGGLLNSANSWYALAFDIYGYYPLAKCTSCTVASTTLTLGGTITGVFAVGQTLLGSTVTGVGTGAGSNTTITSCTPVGANVCGTTVGDTLGLSQASTVSSGATMLGTIAPPANNAGNGTTSPVRAFGAICRWNGNGNQCNGWLLKRDLDPASNDNDPMFLPKAA